MAQHPLVINPTAFLREVWQERLPNPYIPDTPARIAADTSQKIPIRFGINLQNRKSYDDLQAIPFFFALWLLYLKGRDDNGKPIAISPDPRLQELQAKSPRAILSDASIFGVDLYAVGLGERVEAMLEQITPTGAVARALKEMIE
jgi:fructuronate reductase